MFVQAALILLILFGLVYWKAIWARFNLPPGPWPLPVFGNLLQLDHRRPQRTIQKWSKQYGPVFTMYLGANPVVMVTDYEIMKDALTKHGDQLSGRVRIYSFDLFLQGNYGLVFSDGDIWKEQRRASLQILRSFGLGRNVMEEKILFEAKHLSASIVDDMKGADRVVMDLSMSLQLCVGNIIASMLFGHRFEKGSERCALLKKTLDDNFKLMNTLPVMMLNSYAWLRFVPLFGHFGVDALKRQEKTFTDFLKDELEQHKDELRNREDAGEEPTDFVEAYLKEIKRREQSGEDMSYFSDWQLIMIASDLFTAGMETTVTTLRWAIVAMLKYPNAQRKAFDEIDSVLGRERPPSMSDRQSLPYVMATLSEVQRWGNIVPINISHTNETDFEMGGYRIPKSAEIVPQISALAVDEKIFPSPEQFRPERFLEDDGKTLRKIDQFAPFSMGKRQCLGEGLARAELFLIFVHLMQNFELAIPDGAEEPSDEAELGLTSAPKSHETLVKLRS